MKTLRITDQQADLLRGAVSDALFASMENLRFATQHKDTEGEKTFARENKDLEDLLKLIDSAKEE